MHLRLPSHTAHLVSTRWGDITLVACPFAPRGAAVVVMESDSRRCGRCGADIAEVLTYARGVRDGKGSDGGEG